MELCQENALRKFEWKNEQIGGFVFECICFKVPFIRKKYISLSGGTIGDDDGDDDDDDDDDAIRVEIF